MSLLITGKDYLFVGIRGLYPPLYLGGNNVSDHNDNINTTPVEGSDQPNTSTNLNISVRNEPDSLAKMMLEGLAAAGKVLYYRRKQEIYMEQSQQNILPAPEPEVQEE